MIPWTCSKIMLEEQVEEDVLHRALHGQKNSSTRVTLLSFIASAHREIHTLHLTFPSAVTDSAQAVGIMLYLLQLFTMFCC